MNAAIRLAEAFVRQAKRNRWTNPRKAVYAYRSAAIEYDRAGMPRHAESYRMMAGTIALRQVSLRHWNPQLGRWLESTIFGNYLQAGRWSRNVWPTTGGLLRPPWGAARYRYVMLPARPPGGYRNVALPVRRRAA